jgi:hypothetical protein
MGTDPTSGPLYLGGLSCLKRGGSALDEPYRRLAAAVILQAVSDARYLHRILAADPLELEKAHRGRGSTSARIKRILDGPDPMAWLRGGSVYHEATSLDPESLTDEQWLASPGGKDER